MVVTYQHSTSRELRSTRSRLAFTLVELLVVIGIIALLISILLPALNKARQSANQTKCMANLRSIGQGLFIYANMHRGTLPFGFTRENAAFYPNVPYTGPSDHWDTLIFVAMSSNRSGAQYSAGSTGTPGSRAIFVCPEVTIETDVSNARLTHYSAHPVLFPDMQGEGKYAYVTTNPRRVQHMKVYKLADIKRAAETAAIFDGVIDNAQWGAYTTAFAIHNGAMMGRPSALTSTHLIENFTRTGVTENLDTPVNMTTWEANGIPNSDSPTNDGNIRFRHSNNVRANALMMDGHVQAFSFDKKKPLNAATDMTLRNLCIPPNN